MFFLASEYKPLFYGWCVASLMETNIHSFPTRKDFLVECLSLVFKFQCFYYMKVKNVDFISLVKQLQAVRMHPATTNSINKVGHMECSLRGKTQDKKKTKNS